MWWLAVVGDVVVAVASVAVASVVVVVVVVHGMAVFYGDDM